jgi:hypothetical protein
MDTLLLGLQVAAVGAGATAVMDAWIAALARLGMRGLDLALVGRWLGHLVRGKWSHAAIAKAPPVAHERALGWLVHYAVGVAFAALLVTLAGPTWLRDPSFSPALMVGVATVAAPWLVMQPAMGAGFFASRTPKPLSSCARSLASHAVFGAGLYLAAVLLDFLLH